MNEINMAPHSTSTFLIQFVYQENVWSKQLYLLFFIYSIYIYIYIYSLVLMSIIQKPLPGGLL